MIGAGSGGLVVAIGAAKAGKKVLLIEKGPYGGDCTNFGCIPSKSLIASAEIAHAIKKASDFGIYRNNLKDREFGKKAPQNFCSEQATIAQRQSASENENCEAKPTQTKTDSSSYFGMEGLAPNTQTNKVFERIQKIVSSIRLHEEPSTLTAKGIDTHTGIASFLDLHRIKITETNGNSLEVCGDAIVIATGSSPLIPNIEGLSEVPFLTNETIFDLKKIPKRLCILGGGPIGCEMAQAFSRLGSKVALIHRHPVLLNKEEDEAQQLISTVFANEGIDLFLGFDTQKVSFSNEEFKLTIRSREEQKEVFADALLVAIGRRPNIHSLNLESAQVKFSEKGIYTDKYGRTSQKHIWAIGDVVLDGPKFTHAAENQGRKVLASLLLPIKQKIHSQAMPRTTFTDPEVASFGLLENQAADIYGKNIAIYYVSLSENDRAITAGTTDGFVKIITKKMSSHILGATIVSPRAGEMISELSLAAKEKIPLRKLSSLIHPYPTYSLAIRKAADLWLTQTFLPWMRNPFKGFTWKRFIPMSIILILLILFYAFRLEKYLTMEYIRSNYHEIKSFVDLHKILAPLLYILLYAISTAILIPVATFLSTIGGVLFGIPWSTFYVVIGASSGACILFLSVRAACSEMLKHMAGPALKKMVTGFQKNAWSYLLFLRLIPIFPFWIVNIAAGFFEVNFWTFLWTTFVGIIPGSYAYTQAGAAIGEILATEKPISFYTIFNKQMIIALIALTLIILITQIARKISRKVKND